MTKAKKAVEIVVDPGNARVHDERNQQVIQQSLRELGAGRSIVIDKAGQVIAGNETYRQAKALGLPVKIVESDGQTLIVVQRKDLAPEDERRRALAIADNRSSDLSEFDMGILANTLKEAGPELRDAMGFTEKELAQVFRQAQPKELKDPPAPPAPEEPRARPGQLFILGPHRLLCGDATKKKDVKRLMAGEKADMVFTDPPYGVGYVGKTKDALTIQSDDLSSDELEKANKQWFDGVDIAIREGAYLLATVPPGPLHLIFAQDWVRRGWLRQIMVWNKDSMVLGHSEYHYKHEPILFGWKPGSQRYMNNDRTRTTVWDFERPKTSREHPTMKPVAMWAYGIGNHSGSGDIVYDPFLGSGTTLVAADQLERVCYGLEIDPGYCDVIIQRYCALKEIEVEEIYPNAGMSHDVPNVPNKSERMKGCATD